MVSTVSEQARQVSVPTSAGIALRDVTLRNGVRLGYAERGPRLGPVMLMLHGYSDSWFSFSRVLPLCPKELRVFALDQRGHGESDRPASGYRSIIWQRTRCQFMDALNIPCATIVGHSMGSFVARRIAERAPTRVSRLVLSGRAYTARTPAVAGTGEAVGALTDPWMRIRPGVSEQHDLPPVPSGFLRRVIEDSRRVPSRVWKAALAGQMEYMPSTMPLQVPGDRDRRRGGWRVLVGRTARDRPHAARRQLPHRARHRSRLHWEDPDRFVELMR